LMETGINIRLKRLPAALSRSARPAGLGDYFVCSIKFR
jgi:hypothetical protein